MASIFRCRGAPPVYAGAAYLLHDRLHACSDYTVMDVCSSCGSLLAPTQVPAAVSAAALPTATPTDSSGAPFLALLIEATTWHLNHHWSRWHGIAAMFVEHTLKVC